MQKKRKYTRLNIQHLYDASEYYAFKVPLQTRCKMYKKYYTMVSILIYVVFPHKK